MSNRNIADLFGNSAVRPTEGNEKVEQHENNDNETLQQHNDNVNVNVNKTLEGEGETTPSEVTPETPTVPTGATPGDTDHDPETPKEPTPIVNQDDILDFLKEDQEKKVVGFHLDKDVRQAFQKLLGKKPQRGKQSELANRIFRDFFEKRGLL
ncbi:hypothetical protein [Bacillus hominis]|uniref:hypothetical protein n=1 Tax=Bacillus hominis TaxID=2817478 RepID=UPI001BB30139|nr:hypothetical protein [Bacillus hominis]